MRVLGIVALVLAACWPTVVSLHMRWTDWDETTYTHGYLVAAICVYLLWRANRKPDSQRGGRSSPLALAGLVATGLAWVFAVRAGIAALEWLLLPALIMLAIWASLGTAAARRNGFAVGFLYFALPLWDSLNGLFQWATVFAVRGMLRLVGIPSHFEGNFVQVPAGTFEIEGGCSGLHYAMVALALGALMGELRGDSWRGRAKLLLLAGGLAVVTNWIRVFTIILAGHYTDMQHYLVAESHYNYGWFLFAGAMMVFFLLERRMATPADRPGDPITTGHAGGVDWRPVLAVVLVLALTATIQVLSARPANADLQPVVVQGDQWSPAVNAGTQWEPRVQGADSRSAQNFASSDGRQVQRFDYVFLTQRQAKELGGYGNDLAAGHSVVSAAPTNLAGWPVLLREAHDHSGKPWLIASSYRVGPHHYASALRAQLDYALFSLLKLRSRAASVMLWRTPCVPDCPAAEQLLGRFVETMEDGRK